MSRRKVTVNCLFCNKQFDTFLRWEGLPEKEYCSLNCQSQDEEFDDEETFEKLKKGPKEQWH